ncbi:hypothetical protein B0T16DRAFT_405353 [Cercophora newfieldiana]|uniref:ADP-ribose 1''-phosphate phosphatase n=1 Tax=Cercophora newfieldiana TaxID=92897 RepID=A0AA39YG92_9PEZI|nr:hypothetical protein B0T16DRAFT_405353 [Cercophora newfieldiana]
MNEKKAKGTKGGPRQFTQTKLTFGSAFQTQPQSQQPQHKRQKLTDEDAQDDNISSKPDDALVKKDVAAAGSNEGNKSPSSGVSKTVLPALKDVSDDPEPQQHSPANLETQDTQHGSLRIRVTEKVGDIFDAPPRSILIHACNAVGSWGGGIALAFRQHYPDAFKIYNGHCKRSVPQHLVGTALLIAPRDGTRREHYVGCLFTSRRFGKNKDSPSDILRATEPAMRDLIKQIMGEMASGEEVGEVRICHINSGLFAVPWDRSKNLIESLQFGDEEVPDGVTYSGDIIAYSPN